MNTNISPTELLNEIIEGKIFHIFDDISNHRKFYKCLHKYLWINRLSINIYLKMLSIIREEKMQLFLNGDNAIFGQSFTEQVQNAYNYRIVAKDTNLTVEENIVAIEKLYEIFRYL
jgi:hypothetical protein